eukprot:6149020-Pleurochrysis_carterae.AAC.2
MSKKLSRLELPALPRPGDRARAEAEHPDACLLLQRGELRPLLLKRCEFVLTLRLGRSVRRRFSLRQYPLHPASDMLMVFILGYTQGFCKVQSLESPQA